MCTANAAPRCLTLWGRPLHASVHAPAKHCRMGLCYYCLWRPSGHKGSMCDQRSMCMLGRGFPPWMWKRACIQSPDVRMGETSERVPHTPARRALFTAGASVGKLIGYQLVPVSLERVALSSERLARCVLSQVVWPTLWAHTLRIHRFVTAFTDLVRHRHDSPDVTWAVGGALWCRREEQLQRVELCQGL